MSEVKKVVDELNEAVFTALEDRPYCLWFELVELPVGEYIKFAGQYLWDSENDDRPWIDDDNRQDLKEYLLEQCSLIKHSIYLIMKEFDNDLHN